MRAQEVVSRDPTDLPINDIPLLVLYWSRSPPKNSRQAVILLLNLRICESVSQEFSIDSAAPEGPPFTGTQSQPSDTVLSLSALHLLLLKNSTSRNVFASRIPVPSLVVVWLSIGHDSVRRDL